MLSFREDLATSKQRQSGEKRQASYQRVERRLEEQKAVVELGWSSEAS